MCYCLFLDDKLIAYYVFSYNLSFYVFSPSLELIPYYY